MADYRQNKIIATRREWAKKSENHYTWNIHITIQDASTIPTVLCTSHGLTCGYIIGINDKGIAMSCVMQICHNRSEFNDYYLVYYPLIILQ